jgi:general secretion pathway protein D
VFINALATKSKVNILSNPRIVAKSGSDAKIQVGTQVPVLRQQSSNPGGGQLGVTNSIDYIDTGVVLNVRPIIRADKRVDLQVGQEVSEASQNDTSSIGSPLIFKRAIDTSLSLQDGQTVLLGGLKSTNKSNNRNSVPGLGSVPVAGTLFRSQSAGTTDTELLIFITPYIVSDPRVSDSVVARYRDTMRKWPRVSGGLEW